jgi:hypothetical protein
VVIHEDSSADENAVNFEGDNGIRLEEECLMDGSRLAIVPTARL